MSLNLKFEMVDALQPHVHDSTCCSMWSGLYFLHKSFDDHLIQPYKNGYSDGEGI